MQPTYFASFLLGKQGGPPVCLSAIIPHVDNWIFQNKNRKVERPTDFDAFSEQTHRLPKETLVHTRYVKDGLVAYLAIRYEHSDNKRRLWRTDVVFNTDGGRGNEVRCSVGVHVGNQDGAIVPLGDVASRPAIVPTLINNFSAYEAYPLLTTSMPVHVKDVGVLMNLLTSPQRHIPLVLITSRNADGQFIVNKEQIAEKLAGMAYVVHASSAEVTYAVRDVIGNEMNAYDGALRLYWPGFKDSDSPYRHPLWVRGRSEEIEANRGGFAQFLLRNLAKISATRAVPGVTRWEDVQRKKIQADAQTAQGEGELRQLLDCALQEGYEQKTRADTLSYQLDFKQLEIDEKQAELEAKAGECDQWRNAWVQVKKERSPSDDEATDDLRNVGDALEKGAQIYADSLVIIGSALRKETLDFKKPEVVLKALRWLATDYRRARLGEILCPDLDVSCRTVSGMFYRPHQSKVTMGRFEDDYKVVRNGKPNWLKEHIGIGTGTDPRSNIRIAFYFDDTERKVIVGFVGQHQETTASN
ncbi:MAG: hypothetical protein HY985_01685 [Magnetospirillum sp.]|nr:hypothetical protein [Magnetospirillum sp.]